MNWVGPAVGKGADTPEVLKAYAAKFSADPAEWYFLTGPQAAIHRLAAEGFRLGGMGSSDIRSTRLVLIDRDGRIRGYYDGVDRGEVQRLIKDIRLLLGSQTK